MLGKLYIYINADMFVHSDALRVHKVCFYFFHTCDIVALCLKVSNNKICCFKNKLFIAVHGKSF